MRRIQGLFFIALLAWVSACSDEQSFEQESDMLKEQLARIEAMANTESCQEGQQFEVTAIGHKACGGPTHFIAYSLDIDIASFLQAVETYTEDQRAFNLKWGTISDCSLPQAPSSVACIDGEVTLVY